MNDRRLHAIVRRSATRLALRLGCALLALLLLALPAAAHAQEGPLHVPPGVEVAADLATVGRDILIEGAVLGDVTSWSGTITITGSVRGDVVSYSGAIHLGPQAQVGGNVLALAGGVAQETGALVAGQLLGPGPVGSGAAAALGSLFGAAEPGNSASLPAPIVSAALALAALALALMSVLLWPRRTTGAGRVLLAMPWRSLALGLVTTVLMATLLAPLALVAALTLVGLPLLLLLLAGLHLPYVYGLAAVAQALGSRLVRTSPLGSAAPATILGAAGLLLPIIAVSFVSFPISALLFYVAASFGLGAVILSRGGAFAPAT